MHFESVSMLLEQKSAWCLRWFANIQVPEAQQQHHSQLQCVHKEVPNGVGHVPPYTQVAAVRGDVLLVLWAACLC